MMEAFHFMRPWWLLALLPFFIASPFIWRRLGLGEGWRRILPAHLYHGMLDKQARPARVVPFLFLCIGWLTLSVALAGPTWERVPVPLYEQERGVVVVLDMSLNTRATDIAPDRLSRIRFKALDLIEQLEGAQVGLVAYAGDAYAISPLTSDHANLRQFIPALSPEIMPVAGNYPLLAMEEAHRMLRESGIDRGEIYWLAAGMSSDDQQDLLRFFRNKGHRLSALIAGTDERAPIQLSSGELARDSMGRVEMARLNSNLFERVTTGTGGSSHMLTTSDDDINALLASGPLNEQVSSAEHEGLLTASEWRDFGPYLLWLLLPLALWFSRKGVLFSLLPLLLLFPPVTQASSALSAPLSNQSQRAQQLYEAGEYRRAAELFRDPLAQGNAWYRDGDYAAALEAYQRAPDSAERWFNTGNALAQSGDLSAASEAYARALTHRPEWPQAIENKALVDDMQAQQQEAAGQGDDETKKEQDEQTAEQDTQDSAPDDVDQHQADDKQAASPQPADDTRLDDIQQEFDSMQEDTELELDDPIMPETEAESEAEVESMDMEALSAQLEDETLSDEEREELEQLLRRIESDPSQLLRNRMRLEAERRQHGQPPRGARQPWSAN